MNLITIDFVSPHSNGHRLCEEVVYTATAVTRSPTAMPVTPSPSSAPPTTTAPTGVCEKCVGEGACDGVDQSKIGCGSCIGMEACVKLASDVTIGANSCVGERACFYASGELRLEYYCTVEWRQNLPTKIFFFFSPKTFSPPAFH